MEAIKSYHNTNQESGATLLKSEAKCKSQEEKILKFMRLRLAENYTAYEICKQFPEFKESSVRRSLSNLANPKKKDTLRKTGIQRAGSTSSMNTAYTLKNKYSQAEINF